ncbi:uncharacterized protein [Lepeophtheirus salmonis]|uniref:uncharacterized protein n=1 Tax=Lepeophtheirus salmonis TaxID=72036 RepID=UPI001AE6BE2D|nr:dentin sialophosphoprotein-like [Lepeophtheirus salmonis]
MPVIIQTDDYSAEHFADNDVLDGPLNIPEASLSSKKSSSSEDVERLTPSESCNASVQSAFLTEVDDDDEETDEKEVHEYPSEILYKNFEEGNKTSTIFISVNQDEVQENEEDIEEEIESLPNLEAQEIKFDISEPFQNKVSEVTFEVNSDNPTESNERSEISIQIGASKYPSNACLSESISFVSHRVGGATGAFNQKRSSSDEQSEEQCKEESEPSFVTQHMIEVNNDSTYNSDDTKNNEEEKIEQRTDDSESSNGELESSNEENISLLSEETESASMESESPAEESDNQGEQIFKSNANESESPAKVSDKQGDEISESNTKKSKINMEAQCADVIESNAEVLKSSIEPSQISGEDQHCVENIEKKDHLNGLQEDIKEFESEEIVVATISQDVEQIPQQESIEVAISTFDQNMEDLNDKIEEVAVEHKVESMSHEENVCEGINNSVDVNDIVIKEEDTDVSFKNNQDIEADSGNSSTQEVTELKTKMEHSMQSGIKEDEVLCDESIQATEDNSYLIPENSSIDEQKSYKTEINIEVASVKNVDDSQGKDTEDSGLLVDNKEDEPIVEAHQQECTSKLNNNSITIQSLNSEEISKIENKIVEEDQYLELNNRKLNNDEISVSNLPKETITNPEFSFPSSAEKMPNNKPDTSSSGSCARNQDTALLEAVEKSGKKIIDDSAVAEDKSCIGQKVGTSESLDKESSSSSNDEYQPCSNVKPTTTTTTKDKIRNISHSVGETFNLQSVAGEAKSKMESFMGDLNRGSKALASKITATGDDRTSSENNLSSSDTEREADNAQIHRPLSTDFLYTREELTYMGIAFLALLIGFLIQFF